ncbi:Hypothetical protein NGK_1424 [Neisseria gonorrhoeae NCCP11945]|uniref:Uncharacterized protein n=1 Tax=Neisseria gonorrhoeae (strain NCCP11945) TaxID=521006 RepID=B4RMR4_NEIG2|nr:Hypothetical protein NGK_1424 [Neisseria gonorrhoeae NCCP11945]
MAGWLTPPYAGSAVFPVLSGQCPLKTSDGIFVPAPSGLLEI